MDNLVKKGGKKNLKSRGYCAGLIKTVDVGDKDKNVSITFGASSHTGYTNVCTLYGSNDNSTFTTLSTVKMPSDFTDISGYYGCFVKTLFNQPYRYYKIGFSDPSSHGLGNALINAIWEE